MAALRGAGLTTIRHTWFPSSERGCAFKALQQSACPETLFLTAFLKYTVSLTWFKDSRTQIDSDMIYTMMAWEQRLGVVMQKSCTELISCFLKGCNFTWYCMCNYNRRKTPRQPGPSLKPLRIQTVGIQCTTADHTSITSTLFECHLKMWHSEICS